MSHTIQDSHKWFGANPMVYELDDIQNVQQVERELPKMGCRSGCIHKQVKNQLAPLLIRAGAIWTLNRAVISLNKATPESNILKQK
ncbi:hypothetical protein GQ457_01G053570 [Hibiscus cannabinus]